MVEHRTENAGVAGSTPALPTSVHSLRCCLFIAGVALAEAQAPNAIALTTETASEGNRPVLEYRHGGDLYKPYVAKFFSPGGVNVLPDQIADHPHHHGLMFAVGIDGVDFWSETKTCGRQVFRSFSRTANAASDIPWVAVFKEELGWVGPADNRPLAREDRAITVFRSKEPGASLLTWQTRLQPAEGGASVKLAGSHYFGLGMRFVQSMDGADDFFTPEGKAAGEAVRGNERLVRGKWCAYAAEADSKPVTVAMFDHPGNVRPAWWFIMAKAFAYMSATLNLHREPRKVATFDAAKGEIVL